MARTKTTATAKTKNDSGRASKPPPSKQAARRRISLDEEGGDDSGSGSESDVSPPRGGSGPSRRHQQQQRGRRRAGDDDDDDDDDDSSDSASGSDSDGDQSSEDEAGASSSSSGGKKGRPPASFTWTKLNAMAKGKAKAKAKGKGKGKARPQESESESEESEQESEGEASSSSEEEVVQPTPIGKKKGGGGGSSSRKQQQQQQRRRAAIEDEASSEDDEDDEEEEEDAVSTSGSGSTSSEEETPAPKAKARKGKASKVVARALLASESDMEEDEEEEEAVAAAKGSKRKRPAPKAGKPKKKKAKMAVPEEEEEKAESAMHQVCSNARLFHDLFLASHVIGRAADVVHLGSTCKAFGELRAAPTVVEVDLKEASRTLRYPNRFIQSLARPGNRLESLSVKNPYTGEMCRNLSEVLTSGRLDTLEELTFIQGCDDLGVTFTDIVSAKLPALRHLELRHTKITACQWQVLVNKLKGPQPEAPIRKKKRSLNLTTTTTTKKKNKAPHDGGPLSRLESLRLVDLAIPTASLLAWIEGLAHHGARLHTLELGGVMSTATYHIESISQVIADGAFAQLETLLLDDRRLSENRAIGFVKACGVGVRGLRTLSLANQQGFYQWYNNDGGDCPALVKALQEESSNTESGLRTLESLSIGWRSATAPTIAAFLALVFGVDFHESGDGDGGEATTTKRKKKKKKKKKAKGPAFPNLRAMGLIEMKGKVSLKMAEWVVEQGLRWGFTELDFSFNEFPVDKVTRIVEHASLLLVHSFPTHPALFLQMRQITRRFKHRYRPVTWMVKSTELRRHLDDVREGLPPVLAEALEVDIGEAEMNKHDI